MKKMPLPKDSRGAPPALAALLAALVLTGCASTAPAGRLQLVAPGPIGSLHSAVDLQLTLLAKPDDTAVCEAEQCAVNTGFEKWVRRLGARLAAAAYANYPELAQRVPAFTVVVADKADAGSSSDASGRIVIYRGSRGAAMSEEAVAYLIANEMGHVIARHHGEKSAATIISSVLAQLVFAPANLARGAVLLVSSTIAALGRNAILDGLGTEQQLEADAIALQLLATQGWSAEDVRESLLRYAERRGEDAWAVAVKGTAHRLQGAPGVVSREKIG